MVEPRIAVVTPPFTTIDFPSLHSGLVHSALQSLGCRTVPIDLNQELSVLTGRSAYRAVASIQRALGVGDWIGSKILRDRASFPSDVLNERRYPDFSAYMQDGCGYSAERVALHAQMADLTEAFIRNVAGYEEWMDVDAVLLCCSHQQLGFSLSLAALIKEALPDQKITLFGSTVNWAATANCILRKFDYVDAVLLGDAASTILSHGLNVLSETGAVAPVPVPAEAPGRLRFPGVGTTPAFGSFYDNYEFDPIQTVLPWRTSIGCSWGDKSHCTFCGLITEGVRYASYDGLDEFSQLTNLLDQSKCLDVVASDILMPDNHLSGLLPKLRDSELDHTIFFDVRATMSKPAIALLADAGVQHVQVGIESFAPNTLKAMRKGSTPLINIRFLKWCLEYGVCASWIYLHGYVEDSEEALSAQSALIDSICHLQPPTDFTQIRIERGSPIFANPGEFGFCEVKPAEAVLHTYPLDFKELEDISVYFDHKRKDGVCVSTHAQELDRRVMEWRRDWELDSLLYRIGPSFTKIIDHRALEDQAAVITLEGWQREVFHYLDDVRSLSQISTRLAESCGTSEEELLAFLEDLRQARLAVCVGDRWLSVVPRARGGLAGRRLMEKRIRSYRGISAAKHFS